MYAIIETGGKQYRVEEGETIQIEKLPGNEPGDEVNFDKVLMVRDEDGARFGRSYIGDALVKGEITESDKKEKITVFKYKKRKGYRRKQGHRQPYMNVEIDSISNGKNDNGEE